MLSHRLVSKNIVKTIGALGNVPKQLPIFAFSISPSKDLIQSNSISPTLPALSFNESSIIAHDPFKNSADNWKPNWKFYEETPETPNFSYSQSASWSSATAPVGWEGLTVTQKVAGGTALLGLAATTLENMTHTGAEGDSMGPVARSLFRQTYLYTLGGTALAVGTAYQAIRSGLMMRYLNFISSSPMLGIAATLGPFMIASVTMHSTDNTVIKHIAAASLFASIGFSASPLILSGIPAILEAGVLSGGILASLSTAAILSPNDAFSSWGGGLTIGLVAVAVSSFLPMFIRRPGAGTALMHKISMYGGLALFSGFLLYDTKRIQNQCIASEFLPEEARYHPLHGATRIFIDLYNIFVRLVQLSGGSRRK